MIRDFFHTPQGFLPVALCSLTCSIAATKVRLNNHQAKGVRREEGNALSFYSTTALDIIS